jgi:hypothetical protein
LTNRKATPKDGYTLQESKAVSVALEKDFTKVTKKVETTI